MLKKKPHELQWPFHIFTNSSQINDTDLSFAYHAVINTKTNFENAICNDIPCQMCDFQPDCKDGEHKRTTLLEYAKEYFPELKI